MVDEDLTAADTSAKVVELRRVSIDLAFEDGVYTLDVELTDDELAQVRRGEVPERLLPMLRARWLHEFWAEIHRSEEQMHARWAESLTSERIAELERKTKSGEDMTQDEGEQWVTAVNLTRPQTMDEDEWDRWYESPVAESFTKVIFLPAGGREPRTLRRPRAVRPRGRRESRGRRARAPTARSGDDDPDEPPDLDRLIREAVEGAFDAVLGGRRWP